MLQPLTERYKDDLLGVLSCFDRIVITGVLPGACCSKGMTSYLCSRNTLIIDYAKKLADPLRNRLRENAQELARKHGMALEHISKPGIRKGDVIAHALKERGEAPGLVHVISAMEACTAYAPWHDKKTHKTFLRATSGKCLAVSSTKCKKCCVM